MLNLFSLMYRACYIQFIHLVNKSLDETCGEILRTLDLNCLKSNDSTRKPPQKTIKLVKYLESWNLCHIKLTDAVRSPGLYMT